MDLCIMDGYYQIIMPIDQFQKPKYLVPRDGFNS